MCVCVCVGVIFCPFPNFDGANSSHTLLKWVPCAQTRIFRDNWANTINTDALASRFTGSSATMVLHMQDKRVLVFHFTGHKGGVQLLVQCSEILEQCITICFHNYMQHDNGWIIPFEYIAFPSNTSCNNSHFTCRVYVVITPCIR